MGSGPASRCFSRPNNNNNRQNHPTLVLTPVENSGLSPKGMLSASTSPLIKTSHQRQTSLGVSSNNGWPFRPDTSPRSTSMTTSPREHSPLLPEHAKHRVDLERSSSVETVKAPNAPGSVTATTATPPLTPFPPWLEDHELCPESRARYAFSDASGHRDVATAWEEPEHGGHGQRNEARWLISSVLHGTMLMMQCVVTLAVFSVIVWITVWKKPHTTGRFWDWLWKFVEPSLGLTLLVCFGTLIALEIRTLPHVALVYLHAAILMLATLSAMALWVLCLEEESRQVKGVVMGSGMFMWGTTLLGFVRAAAVWMAESDEGTRPLTVAYGTFGNRDEGALRKVDSGSGRYR